jgi:hypothetical protein
VRVVTWLTTPSTSSFTSRNTQPRFTPWSSECVGAGWLGVSPRWARVSFLLDDIHYPQVMYLYEAGQPVIASDIESP